ncbi:MAG: type VI secretion system tip protein VgrG [Rhodocyclaceae bacterium]|nr:type VI secretion system tip protein VgrG [Rhodocyclaceae bacterium]
MIDIPALADGVRWQQTDRLLRLCSPFGEDVLLAEDFDAVECLGPDSEHAGFRIELTALSRDAGLDLDSLLGQPLRVDLLTSQSRDQRRPFHGHCTSAGRLGSNGGFARYLLRIEPWLAFLGHGRDSYIFQDRTVFEIVDEVFGDWSGKGRLQPVWRWEIADRRVYPKRSITTQFEESDLTFVQRLLAEEGLFCWFEHEAVDDGTLGSHCLVIADNADVVGDDLQPVFRYTQPGAVMPEDSIDRWSELHRILTSGLDAASWDYRSRSSRPQAARALDRDAAVGELIECDDPGQYAWETAAQGARLLACRQEALDARRQRFEAEGTIRSAAPATRFVLQGHADIVPGERREYCIVGVAHRARNNLGAVRVGAGGGTGEPTFGEDVPLYRNRLHVIPGGLAWRPLLRDGHGRRIHPRPNIRGTLTAVVVGPGAPTHTDRDHRVRVQFAWQRGSNSASGMAHPSGADNAPASDALGTWVRVMSPVAGANWGGVFVPRPGQEVVVAFMHGDIDRPVVIGALHNGQGQRDAAGNLLAGGAMQASASAPAWFAGETAMPHRHGASLSGIKTQQLSASRTGQGGYNQLVFDDTPAQGRIELGTTEYASLLQLGHLRQQIDNARLADRGHGAEISTAAAAALRAGCGLLLSADARPGAAGGHLDSREPIAQSGLARELVGKLAGAAARRNATLKNDPAPDKLSAHASLENAEKVMSATQTRGAGAGAPTGSAGRSETSIAATGGGEGTVPAWSAPRIQYSAPAGIVQLTPADAILVAGKGMGLVAGEDANLAFQGSHSLVVKDGLVLFTVGKATREQKPNSETGIHLHAASGKVSVQAQGGQLRAAADKSVTVASTAASVFANAKGHLLATAKGASLRIEGGNISLHAPGPVRLKASMKNLTGPKSSSTSAALPEAGDVKGCGAAAAAAGASGASAI